MIWDLRFGKLWGLQVWEQFGRFWNVKFWENLRKKLLQHLGFKVWKHIWDWKVKENLGLKS